MLKESVNITVLSSELETSGCREEGKTGTGEKEVHASPLSQIKVSLRNKVLI